MYDFPFGTQELEGIAARGDFDLSRHQEFSGKSMEYFDEETNEKFVPHVVEPSAGVDRIALALLCNAYREEWVPKDERRRRVLPAEPGKQPPEGYEARTVMRFAPAHRAGQGRRVPAAQEQARAGGQGARGVRHAAPRAGPASGTRPAPSAAATAARTRSARRSASPWTSRRLEDDTVTLRDRDTMKQERVAIADLPARLAESLDAP